LTNNHPECPVIYFLFKTHKSEKEDILQANENKLKTRPIISACDCPTDRVSWLITSTLTPLLKEIPAHLTNTVQLLRDIEDVDLHDARMESFDVESLYTNTNNDAVVECLFQLLAKNLNSINLLGITPSDLKQLTLACLRCNIFRFRGENYKQIRGLAMGNRLAPLLAITYMDSVERRCIIRDVVLYRRYIDDILIITKEDKCMDSIFSLMNSRTEEIKFTREAPNEEGWLPFLDVE
uniref:Reverse transcriptase domain-containing protein n=1 Tax=Anisakis simplex TaxID=6269 RepID=A0A0M3JA55_ANISI